MKAIVLFFSLSFLLFSCKPQKELSSTTTTSDVVSSTTKETTTKKSPVNSAKNSEVLLNKKWRAVELLGLPVRGMEQESQEVFIRFNPDGQFQASGGCNSFYGQYILSGKSLIQFGELTSSERACMIQHFDEQLTSVLKTAEQYVLVGEEEMHLTIGKRAPLAKFKVEHIDY